MDFHVSLTGRRDLAGHIYREMRAAILDHRLRPGERLPPTRVLARRLDVARNTVAVAYDRLVAEGFLDTRVGAGTFVSMNRIGPRLARRAPPGGDVRARRLWQLIPTPALTDTTPAFDFRVGVPDARLFPLVTWRQLVARALRGDQVTSGYGEPAGHAGLRAAIARYVGVSRSLRASGEDIVVTQGAQQALDLIGRILIEAGSVVAVEEPGYLPARLLFRSQGARVVGIPVDAEGLDVSAIPGTARLVYVTPSHQFPLGVPMSLRRRAALLEWATQYGGLIIEDDYDCEFRYEDRPLEPLQSLDRSGRVIYVGSFSKTLLPMLRLGFVVAPASLQPALVSAKRLTDWHSDISTQAAMARLIDQGLLARHVRKATRAYAARRDLTVSILRRDFGTWLEPVPSAAGLHVCARLKADRSLDVERVVSLARRSGVAVESLSGYCSETPTQAGIVVGFGAIPTEDIEEGLRRLADCFRSDASAEWVPGS